MTFVDYDFLVALWRLLIMMFVALWRLSVITYHVCLIVMFVAYLSVSQGRLFFNETHYCYKNIGNIFYSLATLFIYDIYLVELNWSKTIKNKDDRGL